jgi:hypothetical protein
MADPDFVSAWGREPAPDLVEEIARRWEGSEGDRPGV